MLYVKDGDKAKTLHELLKTSLRSDDNFFYTVSTGGRAYGFKATYIDKECTKFDCDSSRRSFSDLYELATTYFPNISQEEFANNLLSFPHMHCFYCSGIGRIVFLIEENQPTFFDARMNPEYNENYKDSTGICFKDIENMAKNFKV